MIKKKILTYLGKLIEFLNVRLKIKNQPLSPAEIYYQDVSKESYESFKKYFKDSYVYTDDNSIRKFAITEALKFASKDSLFLEFGVFKGDSINLFADLISNKNFKIYGFDSFKGLKDAWITEKYNQPGTFSLKGNKPKVKKNVTLIDGWVEETLDKFLIENNNVIAFVHFDLDTYNSTSYVLKKLKKKLQKGSIILFDEFYGFPNWEKYEYKAFMEEFSETNFKYIAFGTRQACVRII